MKELFDREKVINDVENLAYIVADVREGHYPAHSLHQTFDVSAPGNIERVNHMLDLAIAEAENMLEASSGRPDTAEEELINHSGIRAIVHEYLVGRVLTDWLETALPPPAALTATGSRSATDDAIRIWREKSEAAEKALKSAINSFKSYKSCCFVRRLPPI